MAKRDDPQDPGKKQKSNPNKSRSLGRRDFVKLVGGTTVAVSTGVLGGAGLLAAEGAAASASGNVIGPGAVPITLRVNGEKKKLSVEPRVTLLDALRDRLSLTGAKRVCDRGTCGACTVHGNGKAVYSCTTLAVDVAEETGPGAHHPTNQGLAPGRRPQPPLPPSLDKHPTQ